MAGRVNCREASRLLSASGERSLTFMEKVALGLHLVACRMCRDFDRQLKFMRVAAGRFRGGDE